MKGYSYREIGMLAGTAIGGGAAVLGFSWSGNAMFFTIAVIGIALGLMIGSSFDNKKTR